MPNHDAESVVQAWNVLNAYLVADRIRDEDTLVFWADFQKVYTGTHQNMAIVGPWMEARVKRIVRGWLSPEWEVSGPTQIYDPQKPGLRSRSWDLVVHRTPACDLPPPASPECGFPLLRTEDVAAVVDTKTFFSDPAQYAKQCVFNLANDAVETQIEFLGSIRKIILIAGSSRSPDSLLSAGRRCGLDVFSMGRYRADAVSEGALRKIGWHLECYVDGTYPMQRFRNALISAVMNMSEANHV